MRIIKFSINEDVYEDFISICKQEKITIKKKLNVLLSQDNEPIQDINAYFPDNHTHNIRSITLKTNEELYKGVMKRSDILGIKSKKYVPYLIYKFLSNQ